jgi:hypothetical protein
VVDPLHDPELAAAAAALRAEWRADEEEWALAALERWHHDQTFLDVARECMYRGDTVAMHWGTRSFSGQVSSVGADVVRVVTGDGPVAVHVDSEIPLALRVVRRVTAGGGRGGRDPATFRAALLDLETSATRVEVGIAGADRAFVGLVRVGRDQVAVIDAEAGETYVPIRRVTWVRAWVE